MTEKFQNYRNVRYYVTIFFLNLKLNNIVNLQTKVQIY
jgi:hypothetical protein